MAWYSRLPPPLQGRVAGGLAYGIGMLFAASVGPILWWPLLLLLFWIAAGEMRALVRGVGGWTAYWAYPLLIIAFGLLAIFPRAAAGLLVVAFVFDTASYYGGRRFGGRKLVPALSPGKTVSGLLSGFVALFLLFQIGLWYGGFLIIAAAAAGYVSWMGLLLLIWMLGIPFVFSALLLGGDLLISWLKRRAGVKDTGDVIPGHGGILDRMDSLLLAAPLVVVL